jgi:hypothetical protein
MEGVDEKQHVARMTAHGTDKRGQGGADATIVSKLQTIGDARTKVELSTDYRITGRLARFGRGGMIEDVSEKLLRRFAACLQTSLAGDGGAEAPAPDAPATPAAPDLAAPPDSDAPAAPAAPASPAAPAAAPEPAPAPHTAAVDRVKRNPLPVIGAVAVLVLLVLRRRRRIVC